MMTRIWNRLFLEERPSIGLSFFRVAVAITTGAHVIPTFFHLDDNFFATALKETNDQFFTPGFIDLVQKSSDQTVVLFVVLFCVSWFFFLIGLWSQVSCVVMTACCYYFYALNSMHIGTLSWDILLVTLFLMCVTPYHGDYFSVDALVRNDPDAYKRKRPFFLQRLLQLQIASTFFYTALYKISKAGNWLTDNPIYYLMNYPPSGVTKWFLIRDFMAQRPELCHWAGIFILTTELLMPFLLFIPKTRISAIYLGFIFHIMMILTLDVPSIFFFLFPAQLLLFINPNGIVRWIEHKRQVNGKSPRSLLIYDGNCGFCQDSVKKILVMDLFATLELVDFQTHPNLESLHPQLTKEKAASQFYLIEPNEKIFSGFMVFRRLCFTMPMLYPTIPLVYFPGSGVVGPIVYRFIAKNRYLLHFNKTCRHNSCFRK